MPPPAAAITARGRCHATFAYEIGTGIDLDRCEQAIEATARRPVRSRRRVPPHFEYRPAPLRLLHATPAICVDGRPIDHVDLVLFDFGAVAATYVVPFDTTLDALVDLAIAFETSADLARDATERVGGLVPLLGSAILRPGLGEQIEEYLIIELDDLATAPAGGPRVSPSALWQEAGPAVAQILRATRAPLSAEEVHEVLRQRFAFATTDVTIIDWNAAILFDPDPEETRVLLEFANVQLQQLRHLDRELDRVVDQAYEELARAERGLLRRLRPPTAGFRRLGELQMDGAVLFERITSAVKLAGDEFLSRVYAGVSERFHFADWDRAITRKLEVIDGVYQKLSDRVMARRLEMLEWIVIALIGLELVFSLLRAIRG